LISCQRPEDATAVVGQAGQPPAYIVEYLASGSALGLSRGLSIAVKIVARFDSSPTHITVHPLISSLDTWLSAGQLYTPSKPV